MPLIVFVMLDVEAHVDEAIFERLLIRHMSALQHCVLEAFLLHEGQIDFRK